MSATPGTAIATLQIETERVRVTRWDFPGKGDNTGWHRHAYDYVVVPLVDGVLEIADADGNRTRVTLVEGASYNRPAGVEHDVINGSDAAMAFVEIELLD